MLLCLTCVNDTVFRPPVSFIFTLFKTYPCCRVSTARIHTSNLSALTGTGTWLCHQLLSTADSATQAVGLSLLDLDKQQHPVFLQAVKPTLSPPFAMREGA